CALLARWADAGADGPLAATYSITESVWNSAILSIIRRDSSPFCKTTRGSTACGRSSANCPRAGAWCANRNLRKRASSGWRNTGKRLNRLTLRRKTHEPSSSRRRPAGYLDGGTAFLAAKCLERGALYRTERRYRRAAAGKSDCCGHDAGRYPAHTLYGR